MSFRGIGGAALVAGCLAVACSFANPQTGRLSYAAFVFREPKLRVFPFGGGRESELALPFTISSDFAFDSAGDSLYGSKVSVDKPLDPPSRGVFRIRFSPIQAALLPGTEDFWLGPSIAVSAQSDKFLAFGATFRGQTADCGIFEFVFAARTLRKIVGSEDCLLKSQWTSLSLAPDNREAVGIQEKQMKLIDLVTRSARVLGDGFYQTAWSSDGKWVAAATTHQEIVLYRAPSMARQRTLGKTFGSSMLRFSPDSRFLLALNGSKNCGDDVYSLDAIEVESGHRTMIDSSRCRIVEGVGGWIRFPGAR